MRILLLLLLCLPLTVTANFFTSENNPALGAIREFNADDLCAVAKDAQRYLNEQDDVFSNHAGRIVGADGTLERVEKTLAFICQTVTEDQQKQQPSRLQQPAFLQQHFEFFRWTPDKASANAIAGKSTNAVKTRLLANIPADQIFLTKYYTKLLDASPVQTAQYHQALYALPFDEQALSLEQAEQQKATLTRYQFTRQQIINGALLKGKLAKPLVWLSENDLHDVLLQGTGVLNVAGQVRYFNVHRNNGIGYDYHLGKQAQARYWYFAEVPGIMGYGKTLASKIAIKAQVTFAGNVAQLGLGKLIMVSYVQPEQTVSQLGILADQGGAFDHNLFQLDFLAGSYRGWDDFHQANKHLPDYAKAWIMLLKV